MLAILANTFRVAARADARDDQSPRGRDLPRLRAPQADEHAV